MAPEMEGTHITGFSEKGSDCPGTENVGGSRDERGTLEGFGTNLIFRYKSLQRCGPKGHRY